jgi:hypothetical protein
VRSPAGCRGRHHGRVLDLGATCEDPSRDRQAHRHRRDPPLSMPTPNRRSAMRPRPEEEQLATRPRRHRRDPALGHKHLLTVAQLRAFLDLLPDWDEITVAAAAITARVLPARLLVLPVAPSLRGTTATCGRDRRFANSTTESGASRGLVCITGVVGKLDRRSEPHHRSERQGRPQAARFRFETAAPCLGHVCRFQRFHGPRDDGRGDPPVACVQCPRLGSAGPQRLAPARGGPRWGGCDPVILGWVAGGVRGRQSPPQDR